MKAHPTSRGRSVVGALVVLMGCPPLPEEPVKIPTGPADQLVIEDDPDAAAKAQASIAAATPAPGPTTSDADPSSAEGSHERVAARHILVAYQGAERAGGYVRRTKEEAKARAEELRKRVLAGDDMARLAKDNSDDTSPGGYLGAFGRGVMAKEFEDAAFALKDNEVSQVVESPFGFHVIRREPIIEFHLEEVLVTWKGANMSSATRTKEEARARVDEAMQHLQSGETFASVATSYSDGAAGVRGGDLGWVPKGQMVKLFDDVAFALEPGQRSEVVESPYGFHILQRVE